MNQEVTIKDILDTVDCYSNLDGCYKELKEALQDFVWRKISE